MAKLEAQEAKADELAGGEAAALFVGELPRPTHQLAGDHGRFGATVGSALGQEVPDGDEELAGDGDDGNALRLVAAETGELVFPVRVGVDGAPGGFDEHAAEVAAALFADVAVAVRLTAVVDACAEAGIADEVLGGGEAGDVADGRENDHGGEEGQTGKLDKEGQACVPGWLIAETSQLGFQFSQLLLDVIEGGDVLAGAQPFGGRDVEGAPPVAVVCGEEIAVGLVDVLTIEDAVEAVLDGGVLLDQGAAMGQQGAQFADVLRRDPNLWDQVSSEQFGQADGIVLVGLDGSSSDPFDLQGVGDDGAADEGGDDVVEPPGVAGGFEDDGVGWAEVGSGPGGEVVEVDAAGGVEDDLLLSVDGSDDDKMLVQVDADEAGNGRVVHLYLLE